MGAVQVLMPMGGLGSRFADAGYTTPKPLIEVDGKPMFLRALESFSPLSDVRNIFIIRKDQDDKYDLKQSILELLPSASVLVLDHDTQGAVETCLLAEDVLDDSLPVIVADCDIYFESSTYFKEIAAGDADGLLVTFPSDDPRYSYVETDASGAVVRTAEKVVISSNALLGGYYFKSGELFKRLARSFVRDGLPEGLKEFYMSHLFNLLISEGATIKITPCDTKYIFGTPEELNAYLNGKQ